MSATPSKNPPVAALADFVARTSSEQLAQLNQRREQHLATLSESQRAALEENRRAREAD
ncbi:hypothetical protein [Nocardia nova]|uniref:hypothetical protein n=1 Tax=Nocardia nova TaxID=37330 RepID=UPI0033EA2268